MPPVRTLAKCSTFTDTVSVLSNYRANVLGKPYDRQVISTGSAEKKTPKTKEKKQKRQNYMNLDEFLQNSKSGKSTDPKTSSEDISDTDCPRPPSDLLASLLTLGKMIQDQKLLIQNQSELDAVEKNHSDIQSHISTLQPMSLVSSLQKISENVNQTFQKNCSIEFPPATSDIIEHVELPERAKESQNSSFDSLKDLSKINLKKSNIPEEIKDDEYWKRRKRNNMAAKKSREERRKKELEVMQAIKQLEIENSQLTLMLRRLISRNQWLESRAKELFASSSCEDS